MRVERINGPVLLISGRMDKQWPSERLADSAFQRLQEYAFPHCYEHLRYPDAGHAIGWPNVPTTETKFKHPVSGVEVDHGGTARGTAFASLDSWRRLLRFLEEALTRPLDRCYWEFVTSLWSAFRQPSIRVFNDATAVGNGYF